MRRHWQHTSFCMGQCVSSCGSKRTLDSVPTTPDTENYPGLIPSGKIIHRKNSSSQFTAIEDQDALAFQQKPKSSAAKFVTAFSQRRIATRRINPEGESPVHINKSSTTQPVLPFLQISHSVTYHHGDMKDSTVKNYFRETISSAKKTSSKSVTFSEASPVTTASRKKSFFSFHKSKSSKTPEEAHHQIESSPSHLLSKAARKRAKNSGTCTLPTIVRPLKEKQVCRVTLSPKHGTTVVSLELKENYSPLIESGALKRSTNGNEGADSDYSSQTPTTCSQEMGNASSSSQGLVVEAVKTIKPIVKSNSSSRSKCPNVDVNENNTKIPCTVLAKKSESPGITRKGSKKWLPVPVTKNDSGNVLRNINSIKEENRLLRLKFFLEDSSENSTSPLQNLSSGGGSSSEDTVSKMSRQNLLHNKSAIPLPKSATGKPGNNTSSIPKLYSVPSNESLQTGGGTNPRLKSAQKPEPPQPTNLGSGKWVPAADFFEQPSHANADKQMSQSHTSPTTSKNVRRSSEPPRWISSGNAGPSRGIRDVKCPDPNAERRGTLGHYQHRKLPGPTGPHAGNVPKLVKPVLTSDKTVGVLKNISTKVSVRKPEETKPFYTIGLYQNRPKQTETLKNFGVHQSGFHGVSTGIVKQRTEQYQSKVPEMPSIPKLHSHLKDPVMDKKREERGCMQDTSPKKPGVIRSATYTIRKHGALEEGLTGEHHHNKPVVKAKSDVDPRYLTWTVRKPGGKMTASRGGSSSKNTHRHLEQKELSQREQSSGSEDQMQISLLSPLGYPLQHNPSGASTSSMGTNEDGIGDHVVISDSEYLIDDEISDQPDLTLTFKDSSHKLSPSSSGESLLSDIMLDHLDLSQDRYKSILGELTSDSAISDISSHKPVSKSSCDQIVKLSESTKIKSFEQPCTKAVEKSVSPNDVASPSSVRTIRRVKSPRRISKPTSTTAKTSGQSNVDVNLSRSSSSIRKSPSSSSTGSTGIKPRTTPDKKPTVSKPIQGKTNSQSSTSLSPINRNRSSKEQIVGLTVENVNKLHKQYELVNSQYAILDDGGNAAVPFAEELLVEFQGLKDELEKLRLQLETQEQRERDKDELILRLTSEVERLKSTNVSEKCKEGNINVIASRRDSDHDETSVDKERYINSLNYENAAVQTENNNIFNRSVTYPGEDDKYGELVSFRIGRSSSLKKKL